MKASIVTIIYIAEIILAATGLNAQSLPKDQVIDTVRCIAAKDQSYSLYLPAGYDPKKAWPLIMVFDPAARGKTAVMVFSAAAKKYGFIAACSNNARNGSLSNNFQAASAVLKDVTGRFSTDPARIYVAGFSGGSRFATTLALTQQGFAGVIGCGAGLPNDNSILPGQVPGLVYYGIAGYRDMNYIEMHDLANYLTGRTKIIPFTRFFDGGHEWPEPSLITEAVGWIVMKEMTGKKNQADQATIGEIATGIKNLIGKSQASGNQEEAVMYMRFAARDFQGTPYGSEFMKILSEGERSPRYASSVKDWNRVASREQEKKDLYVNYLTALVYSPVFPDSAMTWWRNEVGSLTRTRDKGSISNSMMAYRLLNFISILCSEQGSGMFRNGGYSSASVMFRICTLSDSENPQNYYNLARAEAALGHTRESTDALASAVSHGLGSRKTVESEPVFSAIKNDEKFRSLISRLK